MKVVLTEQQVRELVILEEEKRSFFQFIHDFVETHKNGVTPREYAFLVDKIKLACKIIGIAPIATFIIGVSSPYVKKAFEEAKTEQTTEVAPETATKDTETIDYPTISNDYIYKRANSFDLSQKGVDHILEFEAYKAEPYNATPDEKAKGTFTIGYGHKMSQAEYQEWLAHPYKLSKKEARDLFEKDIQEYVKEFKTAMNLLPKRYRNPHLYSEGFVDACISIIYNAGVGKFMRSDLYDTIQKCVIKNGVINQADYDVLLSKINHCCATAEGVDDAIGARRRCEYMMAANGDYRRIETKDFIKQKKAKEKQKQQQQQQKKQQQQKA